MPKSAGLSRAEKWIVGLTLAFALLMVGLYVHSTRQGFGGSYTVRAGDLITGEAAQEQPLSWQVDVNHASAAELQQLPGVGEVLASRIIAYREEHGPFTAPEDLLNVEGIGASKLEGMREMLTFGEVTE